MMDLRADLRREILLMLPHAPEDTGALMAMSDRELIGVLANWHARLISPACRQVHTSAALRANPLLQTYGGAIRQIEQNIAQGRDINCHLSRLVRVGYDGQARAKQRKAGKKNLGRQKDLDLLLNDWDVHHLHLTTHVEPDGFVRRTPHLLMAAFRPGDAYLIDIFPHDGHWASTDILRTMVREWPAAELVFEMKGALGLESGGRRSQEEHLKLRQVGLLTPVEIDGKVYFGCGFLSTAGTSMRARISGDAVLAAIDNFEKAMTDNPLFFLQEIARQGVVVRGPPDLHFEFFSDGFGVVDRRNGVRMRLG